MSSLQLEVPKEKRRKNSKVRLTNHSSSHSSHIDMMVNANIAGHKRNSIFSSTTHEPVEFLPSKIENTYVMAPTTSQRFNSVKVEALVNDILANHLNDMEYDSTKCGLIIKLISDEIKQRVKAIVYNRYKLIVSVVLSETKTPEGLNSGIVASRSLWDASTDAGKSLRFFCSSFL